MIGTTSTSASTAMKNGSPNATISDESGMSNTTKAVRLPSKVPKYIASGVQRSAVVWISLPMLPSLTAWLPDSTGIVILAMTRMTAPPLGAAAPVRAPPAPGPLECCPLADIDLEDLPGGAYLGRQFTLVRTLLTGPAVRHKPTQESRSCAFWLDSGSVVWPRDDRRAPADQAVISRPRSALTWRNELERRVSGRVRVVTGAC